MDPIVLPQSRFQRIFVRIYAKCIELIAYVIFSIVLGLLFPEQPITWTAIILLLVLELLYSAYMWFTHPEPIEVISFSKAGFEYQYLETKTAVEWDEFDGYKITRMLPHKVKIKIRDRVGIEFSYYSFSSEQRAQLFRFLDNNL